jgi:uncharacterized protein (UPF0264 family)
MTLLLASVRTPQEALAAAAAGADIVDLKEPRAGALGALPLAQIGAIVQALRARFALPISATIGDWPAGAVATIVAQAGAVAATGVDYVKVGIERGPHARATLARLAALPARVVPLFVADRGLDLALIDAACELGFAIVMVDTADKRAGSLFDCVAFETLRALRQRVHAAGARVGLAGALRFEHVARLRELDPDIAGFRGALCDGDRTGTLDPAKVGALRAALCAHGAAQARSALSAAAARPAAARPDAPARSG